MTGVPKRFFRGFHLTMKALTLIPFKGGMLTALFCLALLGSSYDEILSDKNKQLENVRKDLEEITQKKSENSDKLAELVREIDSLRNEIEALDKFLEDFSEQRFLTPLEIAQEANIVLFLEEEVVRIQESFKNKIVSLYKHGKNYELELLLTSKTPSEFLRRNEYLQRFSQNRKRELRELETKKFILEEKKKLLNLSTSSQRFYIESKRNLRDQLGQRITQLNREKIELENENKLNESRIDIKSREMNVVNSYIKNFVEKKNVFKGTKTSRINYPSKNFEQLKGMLNIPVDVAVIKNEFGNYTDNATATAGFNNGIDFSIAEGSKVYCAADGTVEIIGEIPYYGNVVVVSHEGGYRTVYAVLEQVAVKAGTIVRTNQLIGRSGENQEGQVFHFELWKERTALNPREWLRF
jgi:septal ring factor EnvC (AmiA/AmiB activator)